MLVLTRKVDQKIVIGANVAITVLRIKGNAVKIGVDAPAGVAVFRSELIGAADGPQPGFSSAEQRKADSPTAAEQGSDEAGRTGLGGPFPLGASLP